MSLRIRLTLIVSLLFLTGMVLGVSFQISNARQRVAEEVESTATLTNELLSSLLPASGGQDYSALLETLLGIEDARHLDIFIAAPESGRAVDAEPGEAIEAPAWFVSLVRPAPLEFVQRVGPGRREEIVIRTHPADEIEEVWRESKNFLAVLLMVLLVLNGILYFTIGRWLKPVQAIVQGLEGVEQGDYSGHITPSGIPELRLIADKLNRLTRVLRASQAENNRLTRRSLTIQEEERRHLARELHDEMGQSISAIKAIAFSIARRMRDRDLQSAEGAGKIESISNHVRDHVRSMMGRLRPAVLDELGLAEALRYMVDEWNDHHQESFCTLSISGDFDGLGQDRQIHLYRIVQEALTNVARHARANKVKIRLSRVAERCHVSFEDDGRGFEPGAERGMGLPGMQERARALGGQCRMDSRPGRGLRLEIDFPA